jgi:carbonic anhydrase
MASIHPVCRDGRRHRFDLLGSSETTNLATGCQHLSYIIEEIQQSIDADSSERIQRMTSAERESFVNTVARRHVARSARQMLQQSRTLGNLEQDGRVVFVAAMYDIVTGEIEFFSDPEKVPMQLWELRVTERQ